MTKVQLAYNDIIETEQLSVTEAEILEFFQKNIE